jgi:AraC-like DNA-binding protein
MAKQQAFQPEPDSTWSTIGREIYKHKRIPARMISGGDRALWDRALADDTRFKLALIGSGNTVLDIDDSRHTVLAPAALFLPHKRAVRLPAPARDGARDTLILFHPSYIYDTLGFEQEALRRDPATFYDGYLLARFTADRSPSARTVLLDPGQSRYIEHAVQAMRHELEIQPDEYWPCRGRSFLLEILIACTRIAESQSQAAPAADGHDPELAPVLNFLVSRLHEKLTVDRIAREFNTNRTTLQERVRRATGLPVTQYLIRLRVQTAAVLLRNTSLSIGEIMERTGFSDESHFSRSFKKHADRSPSGYREEFLVPGYIK